MNKVTNGSTIETTDYLQGYQYVTNVLQFFPTAEGYVKNTVVNGANTYDYIYNYTDHLGNIRVSYTKDPSTNTLKIMEENHYYPFGLKHTYNLPWLKIEYDPTLSSKKIKPSIVKNFYKYKYNGKEYQDELGLNVTAMDFRQYDNALGRFMNPDRLAESTKSWSPYRFSFDNPIYWSDPTGLSEDCPTCKTELPTVVVKAKPKPKPEDKKEKTFLESSWTGLKKAWIHDKHENLDLGLYGLSPKFGQLLKPYTQLLLNEYFPYEELDYNDNAEVCAYWGSIILVAIIEPSPGELNAVKNIVIKGGKVTKIIKGVNTMLPHAIEQGVERGIFKNADEASRMLKNLTKKLGNNDLPKGTIIDPSKTDRILVPIGNNGMAVYQIGANGSAKLKTVLIAK